MNLEARLRAFAALVRHRSFSAAATELRISQPAVSKHIADLERILGLILVERSRRGSALTSSGEFVANHVLRAESLLAQAARGAAELRTSGTGSLTIVASWLTGTYLLPKIMAEFKHQHPGVRLSLQLGTAKQAVELLRSHQAELGFVADAGGGPEVEAEPLLNNEVAIVARPKLIPKRVTRESLESLTWISREEGSATRSVSERALTNLGIVPRQRLELPSYETVLWALKNGYGVSAISRYVIDDGLSSGALAVIPVHGWHVRTVISVLRARDALLTPSAEKFHAFARQCFAEITRDRRRRGRKS